MFRRKIFPRTKGLRWFLGVSCLLVTKVQALVPLENVILGNFAQEIYEESASPIESLFLRFDKQNQIQNELKTPMGVTNKSQYSDRELFKNRIKLGLFRGFIEEGFNLENICRQRPDINYAVPSERLEAKRTFLATMQYLILDLTAHYLPLYAKYFEFETNEYENMVNGLVGNHCSQNITTISLKSLKLNMLKRFERPSNYRLPSVKENPYFPNKLGLQESRVTARQNEFAWTVELFKSACSWGNDPDNYGLLVPIVRNPVLSAFVIRDLASESLTWIDEKSSPAIEKGSKGSRISCQNLICRRSSSEDFKRLLPRSVGSTSIRGDFERLYCNEFRDADYTLRYQVPQLAKKIKSITFDEQNLLVGQLIALATGVPDFLVQVPKFNDLKKVTRSALDRVWDSWAQGQKENYEKALAYEEPLQIQVVPGELYFKKFIPKFSIELDINQGELDRVINIVGKLRSTMKLKFSRKFLKWAREKWKTIDQEEDQKLAERVKLPMKKMIEDQVEQLIAGFPMVPLSKEIDELITIELLNQLTTYEGEFFKGDQKGLLEVPVYLNYGIFALKHMRQRYLIKKNQGETISELQKLRNVRL